jgi:hypothetical protein
VHHTHPFRFSKRKELKILLFQKRPVVSKRNVSLKKGRLKKKVK